MHKKHNYPKTRKPRNVEYSKSYKLYHQVGEKELRKLFQKHGMYVAARMLSEQLGQDVSPYVLKHMREKFNLGVKNEKDTK